MAEKTSTEVPQEAVEAMETAERRHMRREAKRLPLDQMLEAAAPFIREQERKRLSEALLSEEAVLAGAKANEGYGLFSVRRAFEVALATLSQENGSACETCGGQGWTDNGFEVRNCPDCGTGRAGEDRG